MKRMFLWGSRFSDMMISPLQADDLLIKKIKDIIFVFRRQRNCLNVVKNQELILRQLRYPEHWAEGKETLAIPNACSLYRIT